MVNPERRSEIEAQAVKAAEAFKALRPHCVDDEQTVALVIRRVIRPRTVRTHALTRR